MAEVFGSIGNEQVELNNAATEATLRLLLQSSLAANKQSVESINKIALRAGVDENTVKQTNQRISAFGQAAFNTGAAWAGLSDASDTLRKQFREVSNITQTLVSGTAQASDVFNMFTRFQGPVGLVADGLVKLAQFQENQLKSYQEMSKAGVNFGGNLTQLRLAASNTYMTMDQFTNLMKNNSESFAKMGGTANDGAMAFTKVASHLQKTEFGDRLRALGYTSEQANQGLANYIAMTGGRNKQEMQDRQGLAAAATEYMSQLDQLAQITGKSREQQEQALKEESANQAYQSYLMTLDEAGRKKANAAMAEAMAYGGKGAAQALQSQLLGLPPMTKAAQEFTAVAPRMAAANNQMASAVKDSSKGLSDVRAAGDSLRVAASRTKEDLGQVGSAIIMSGNGMAGTMSAVTATANRNMQQGIKSEEDAAAQRKQISKEEEERLKSQANSAAKTKESLDSLGSSIMQQLMPAVAEMLSVMNPLIQGLASMIEWIAKTPVALGTLLVVAGTWAAWFTKNRMDKVKEAAIRATRGTVSNPMIVQDISSKGVPELPEKGGPKGTPKAGKIAKLGSLAKGLAGGLGGVVGGLALGYVGDKLKESGNEKAGAGVDVAGSALSGAGTGAMLGSFVPGLGTAIGGALGGIAGGAYGLYQNWNTMFGGTGKEVPKPETKKLSTEVPAESEKAKPFIEQTPGELNPFESLTKQLEKLNTQTTEMVRYLKETSEQIRRNVDATKSLSGNLFPTP